MKKWNTKDSYDDIMFRLEEIENIKFEDYDTLILKDENNKFKTFINKEQNVCFLYEISKYYTCVRIIFSSGGHPPFYNSYPLFSTCNKKFKNRKHEVVSMLNKLEKFLSVDKYYQEEKLKFKKWCDITCQNK